MNGRPWQRARSIKQITRGLGALDRELFEAIADTPTPLLDTVMPPLTRAADHSKLWFAMAAGLLASTSQSAQRGAVRGVVTLGAASLFTNQVAKRIRQRPRPLSDSVPLARRVRRRPTSNSLPSGHSASAAAFAIGVGLIDVRILETGRRLATVRILTALALGRLQRSPLYHELQVPEFSFSTVDAPTVLAHDGEVGEQYDQASFTAKYRVLAVFRPGPGR
ncbi:hypothetical protein TM48_01157 [Mycobacterium shottsii]|uniref:Phosphatidic acid phosphatase type 2/haloperoxidase domain-containing protein n=1 Tax=Mycobacterium shottsii TaxID=133549 RepID=A0A7I7LA58_9MYCO|nr:phosphatase PAP2 family protein [Mycobacterium shottsii]QYL26991.1 hypothetical protein TM48_01157 [Mycobacterium shottsii]BBX56635.1 hypothetical protein MSHO_19800 [Mycobacterium shottsii]